MKGLNDGGHDVLDELRAHADCPLSPHALIVTNGWTANLSCWAAPELPIECMDALVEPG
jgi:hypothetical protein